MVAVLIAVFLTLFLVFMKLIGWIDWDWAAVTSTAWGIATLFVLWFIVVITTWNKGG